VAYGRLTVSNLTPTIYPANLNRSSLLLQQDGLFEVRVGEDATVAAANGLSLAPCEVDGGGIMKPGTGEWYAFNDWTEAVYLLAIGGVSYVNFTEKLR
jgi:hypothetical protein